MNRRIQITLLVLLCMIIQASVVRADLIFEPQDSFYEKHKDACEYVNRVYVVNGYGGETDVYDSPGSAEKVMTIQNRETYYISFVYTDKKNVKWGFVEDSQENGGWVPMDYMYPVYDSQSFYEEYKEKITSKGGVVPNVTKGDVIYGWKYPGSETKFKIEIMEDSFDYGSEFTDEEGMHWGNVGYYMGNKDFWVCIDEPENPDLPVREINRDIAEAPETIPGVAETSSEAPEKIPGVHETSSVKSKAGNIRLVAVLVGLTAAVTGFAVWKFYGKPR